MTITNDVQYAADVAQIYDAVIASTMPASECLEYLHLHVEGRHVLDVGVGTGRLAIPMTQIAESVVGVDNSSDMLKELHRKDHTGRVATKLVDFRLPLPFAEGEFGAAVSMMGSFACVRSHAELRDGFAHVAAVLADGAPFVVEYYSAQTYRALVNVGPITVPNEHHPSSSTMVVRIEDPMLHVSTTVTPNDGGEATSFDESVLLVEADELVAIAKEAGFTLIERTAAENYAAFDRYVWERDPR